MKQVLLSLLMALLLNPAELAAQPAFNADSAYANLQHLAVTIGPRPMGSRAEREALDWVARQFRRFGADTAYIMPIPNFRRHGRAVNTQSGVAVGVFRGKTDSTIVIGGHLDSSGPDIPGANDDGSGTACVVELARVWSQRDRHYTLLFAAFGGEEQGLIGSSHFVEHYDSLQNIILMLQIDMAGSDEAITPFFEVRTHQAPAWLLRDAYAADRELGYNSLVYPTHFFSINNALGGAGSDHQPFLAKNIPALDFTAGINTSPIHTPRDRIDFIQPQMLERSGRIVDAMLQKYQSDGVPAERKGHYMLWQIAGLLLFLPNWLLWAIIFSGLLMAIIAFLFSRKRRLSTDEAPRVRFSGLKVLLLWIGVVMFSQFGEAVMQGLAGYRHPWMTHIEAYFVYAILWAVTGVWLGLVVSRHWRFGAEPHYYFKRPLMFYLLFTLLFSIQGPRLAVYPGTALLLISLAYFAARPALSIPLALLSLAPMARLLFSETFPFYMHNLATGSYRIDSFKMALLQSALIVVFLTFWFWPIPYTLIWVRLKHSLVERWLQQFRKPTTGVALLAMLIIGAAVLYRLPAYNDQWRPVLRVLATYDIPSSRSRLHVRSDEYLRGVTLQADTLTRTYTHRQNAHQIDLPFTANWLQVMPDSAGFTLAGDTLKFHWRITTHKPWLRVDVALSADSAFQVLHADPIYAKQNRMLRFVWEYEPPDTLDVRGTLLVPAPIHHLRRKVEAVYLDQPMPIRIDTPLHDVQSRTQVTLFDTLQLNRALNQTGE
ncbi:MAG: M28 family peptidase [candidate division KSB1 bacterium]|nr:M28 family peptidase [candidate division KSB1 bacterium]